jgi:hypothetical protein
MWGADFKSRYQNRPNAKMNLKETGYEGMDWIKLYQGYGTSYSIKGGKFADELSNYQLLKKQVFRGVS